MNRLATSLKPLPAQVLDRWYSHESFGSWTLTLRYEGSPLRLTFNGRDNEYGLERSSSLRTPYSWSRIWRRRDVPARDECSSEIMDAIRSAPRAG